MPLSLYNTLTKRKEEFVPLEAGRVKLYACGVTVYDLSHIGHARAAVVFDVLVRYLRSQGYEVDYVRNFTDVDDKIIKKAQEEGTDWSAVAEKYIAEFKADMKPLSLVQPAHEPRATEHIPEMISMTKTLMNKGLAYSSGGDVYFSVEKFPGYGKLSGTRPEEAQAGETGEHKKNPLDFALWKGSKPGEPTWESPWGPGRPGWHIECSAMAEKYLGETLDIHGGGMDLIFPHHENEIAQSEGATGKHFARYWVHNGFVNINREKMSKSLGTIFTLKEANRLYPPEAIRFFLLNSHYRSPVDFSSTALEGPFTALSRAYNTLDEVEEFVRTGKETGTIVPDISGQKMNDVAEPLLNLWERFQEAMDDDLNTPQAISHIFRAINGLNRIRAEQFISQDDKKEVFRFGLREIYREGGILGILKEEHSEFFSQLREALLKIIGVPDEKIKELDGEITKRVAEREEARKKKNWAVADKIRMELRYDGIYLEDTPKGTHLRKAPQPLTILTQVVTYLKDEGEVKPYFSSKRTIPDLYFSPKGGDKPPSILVFVGSVERSDTWEKRIKGIYSTEGITIGKFIRPSDFPFGADALVPAFLHSTYNIII